MNRIKFFLTIFALVALGAVSAQSLVDINTKFSEAAAAMQSKDFNKAIPLFEQVIDEGHGIEGAEEMVVSAKKYLPTALFYRAGMEFQKDNLEVALKYFAKAAENAELYGEVAVLNNARTWIGRTVLKQGADAFNGKDYVTAAAIFQKGYDANPNDTGVALNLAMSYSELGDYAKGNDVYRNIIALEGQNSRFDEAVGEAKQKFTDYNLYRASESIQAKNYQDALTATEDIISVISASPQAAMLRVQTFNSMKNYDKVIETGVAAAEAQDSDELRSAANFLIGAAYQNKESYAKAIEYYKKVTSGDNAAAAKALVVDLQKLVK